MTQKRDKFDVVIVGGAVVGSAAAYFLAREGGRGLRVAMVERDPSYRDCATTRSLASIRHQFSTPENIRLSMFGTTFLRQAATLLAVDGQPVDVALREPGYLFLAGATGLPVLQANHAVQRAEGADVVLLTAPELAARWPWLATAGLAAGSFGRSGEGWLDAHALMHGLRRKAVALGVSVLHAEAVALPPGGVDLADGTRLQAGVTINAAGTGATRLARTAGIELPVHARKRCVFHFRSPEQAPGCPLVIAPSGLYFRPEGAGFVAGVAPAANEDPDSSDFEVPLPWWEDRLWPALAALVPGFAAARLLSAWAGHYDVNVLDHNAIIGVHPARPDLLFANGFSGHGLQQAPGVGRALAEWVLHGEYRSIDLHALGWQRMLEGRPLRERNVV